MQSLLRQFRYLSFILPLSLSTVAAGDEVPNGIGVGQPKVFDNRTLTIMLEKLSDSLRNMQFVDQKSLAAAFAFLQGSQSSEFNSNLTVSTLPTPGLKTEDITKTGNVDTTGKALPDTNQLTTTKNRDSIAPQPPGLDTTNPAFSGFNPTYGPSPSDLLSDQVNLNYQIFNLRMLLERSLSDRIYGKTARLQAVLGFNVTIDPPRTANDAVAVVEITIETAKKEQGLSLVSLMPQEKTYNSAALTTKSNSFGGSAVVNIIQVGYNQRRRSQIFYLYRDTDTLSYERMQVDSPGQIRFGWMFRPVLGRRSISPGLRQMFAIISLPATDEGNAAYLLNAHVRTYWKKYDRATMTAFEERDANRAARFRYGMTLTLSKPELFAKRYLNQADYAGIEVKSTEGYQADLRPKVYRVSWMPIGAKSALISAEGSNFFSETQVAMGDKVYKTAVDGLILKSNQAFDLTTSLDALASGPGAVIGRYGPAVPLVREDIGSGTEAKSTANANNASIAPQWGFAIEGDSKLGPALSGSRLLEVYLRAGNPDPSKARKLDSFPQDPVVGRTTPIVTVNGKVVPFPYNIFETVDHVVLQANVPDSFIANGGATVKVSWPFLPDRWTATRHFNDPTAVFEVGRLSSKSIYIKTKDPVGFTIDPSTSKAAPGYCWQLLIDDKPIKLKSETCAYGDSHTTSLSSNAVSIVLEKAIPDRVLLIQPIGTSATTFSVEVPKASSDSAKSKPITLKQNDSAWVEVAVKDVSKVAFVEANQQRLNYRVPILDKPGETPKVIQVEVTRILTAKPGSVDVTVVDKDGKTLGGAQLEISCRNCNGNGEKE